MKSEIQKYVECLEKTPGVCGGSTRIRNTRIPVWLLKSYKDSLGDEGILESYDMLTSEDLDAAWLYCENHKEEIEREVEANEI